ncbi:MAG: S1 RNA-binding domain-containing protein [Phycisphaerales bacterium]
MPSPVSTTSAPGAPGVQADHMPEPRPPQRAAAPPMTDEMHAEMEAAMAAAMSVPEERRQPEPGRPAHGPAPLRPAATGHAPAPIRGPRVVQAGRELRPGVVVSVGPADIFVEFGPKELGVIPRLQWAEGETLPEPKQTLEVVVDRRDDDGLLLCSRPGSVQKADWELLEPGQVIEARVTGVNKGGLELEVTGHTAFMPAGQVSTEHIADLSVFVGEKLRCQVMRVDRSGRGNIVLSHREVMMQERRERAEKLKTTLAEGQVVEGTVRKLMPFGAFVDLGGVDGLVHVSDLTHDRVGHGEKFVQRYVKEGDRVKVQVLKLDWEAGRLSLGIKQVQADPFAQAANDIKEGAEVTGRITKLAEFGAFMELAAGVEGLVHISELAWRRVGRVEEVVKPDEVVKAKVLRIDPQSRRISLSIKALTPPPEKPGLKGRERDRRSPEEVLKVSPELRRLREKFGGKQLKGGIG